MALPLKSFIAFRVFVIIPTLVIISLITFFLSIHVPQDPAYALARMRVTENNIDDEVYEAIYKELGMDKPNFYFSITPTHYPPSLNIYSNETVRKKVKALLRSGVPYDKIIVDGQKVSAQSDTRRTLLFPKFHWNGFSNRYHHWITSFFFRDMGQSIMDGQTVSSKIGKAFLWTIALGLLGIIFSYSIAIFLGLVLAQNPNSRSNKIINQLLYLIFSIPLFWIATLLVIYFTTDTYGRWMNIFPSVGIDIYPGESTVYQIMKNAKNFILPVLCLSLPSITYIARLVRRSILDQLSQPYILTAASKGLTDKQILRRHAFPNAMLPLVTIFVESIPSVLGGSVLMEVIFNLPGIGRLLFDSIGVGDWNVVFGITMIIALVTTLSYLLGDILYGFVNPKIRFA